MMIRSTPPDLGGLGGQPGAGTGTDDRPAGGDGGPQAAQRGGAVHLSAPFARRDQIVQQVRRPHSQVLVVDVRVLVDDRHARCRRPRRARRRTAPRRRPRRGRPCRRRPAPRHPLRGTTRAVGPVAAASLVPNRRPSSAFSSAVVRISVTVGLWTKNVPVREALGHGVPRAEVHHVERAEADHLRYPRRAGGGEPVGPGGEHATDQVVGEFGGGEVEHAGQHPGPGERLQRPPAGAGRVEHQHLVPQFLQPGAGGVDRWRRHPEHRRGDERTLVGARPRPTPGARRTRGPSRPRPAAALPSTARDTWLMPAMSTTLYIIVTSLAPT